jgi:hypothetical protein
MLFAGDVGTNLIGLGDPVGFESLEEGRASQRKLASLSFDPAGFGHGGPIVRDASTHFRKKWGIEEARKKSAARHGRRLRWVNRYRNAISALGPVRPQTRTLSDAVGTSQKGQKLT